MSMTIRTALFLALTVVAGPALGGGLGTLPPNAQRIRFVDMTDTQPDFFIFRVSDFDTVIICPGGGQSLQNWTAGPGTLIVGFTDPFTLTFEATFSTTFAWLQYQPASQWIIVGYESTASSFKDSFESCDRYRT